MYYSVPLGGSNKYKKKKEKKRKMKLWKLQREGAATECIFQFQSEVNKIKGIFRWRESFYVFFKSFFNCLTSKVAFPNIKMIFDSKSPLSQREPVWQIQLLQNWNWKYFKIFFLEKCCFFLCRDVWPARPLWKDHVSAPRFRFSHHRNEFLGYLCIFCPF